MNNIVWFRKDLRTFDNLALYFASKNSKEGVVGLYIIDASMWTRNHVSQYQIEFIFKALHDLQDNLKKIGITLIIKKVKHSREIPRLILKIMAAHHAQTLYFNREYEVNEKLRDQATIKLLKKNNLKCSIYDDQLILPPKLLFKKNGEHFKVFSAFKRQWLKIFGELKHLNLFPKPKIKNKLLFKTENVLAKRPKSSSTINLDGWKVSEIEASKLLKLFIRKRIDSYHQNRDFPFIDATSQLSPYLAIGLLSPRQCFLSAFNYNNQELASGNPGALMWMNELIWREFYRHILIAVPSVCKNRAFKPKTEALPWSYDKKLLRAWQRGQTGFPIVDAAMRQLNETGWMHNRLRMIVAMFLSKNLFLDWRLGEKYFSEKLIDIDFASNNGGWQWSASTGTDSVPYFRIFNPTTQSERFDPEGKFIRRFCPELRSFNNYDIHDPYKRNPQLAARVNYVKPIVDYASSRARALQAFKKIK
jgi:deoxyribodipyrimidine photo-lyase